MNDQTSISLRETLPYWQEEATLQNFGDYLTEYLVEHLFLRTPLQRRDVRLIGSYLDDGLIAQSIDRHVAKDPRQGAALLAWAGGLREPGGITQAQRPNVEILSVRGPLSRQDLGLDTSCPIGDPGLLLPALYSPQVQQDFVGHTLCVPHFLDARSVQELLAVSGADHILRPNIPKSLVNIEHFVDALTSASFVLCGSLHAAIVAAAYGRPFAFWDNGTIDIPFKWKDFAASCDFPCGFQTNVRNGRAFYEAEIRDALRLPSLWPMLSVAPFPIRSEALIRLLIHEAARTGAPFDEIAADALKVFVQNRQATEAPLRAGESFMEDFRAALDAAADAKALIADRDAELVALRTDVGQLSEELSRLTAERDALQLLGDRHKAELSSVVAQAAQLSDISAKSVDALYLAYRRPLRPLTAAVARLALKFALAFKPVLPLRMEARFSKSLNKRRPSTIRQQWRETVAHMDFSALSQLLPKAGDGHARLLKMFFADQPIYFPAVERPAATIIIPSYQDCELLTACLQSLAACRDDGPSFEVIVIDDCPEHPTVGALPDSPGLRKIQNEENLGFLLSCNKAAASARGRVICFLNSDTIVTIGWLASLIEALDADASTGIVGGMLLNDDGSIQDAGWRVLANGWGHKIGENAQADDCAFTYRRQVDCVTGACLALPAELWERLSGFDDRYAPAFYEEFDLCFRVRELGLKVVYEPCCRVFHLGSASYGSERRDELSNRNHALFSTRHAEALCAQPAILPAPTVWSGHIAGPKQRCLLMIDDFAPDPTTHAGALTTYSYIRLFVNLGWHVVFGAVRSGRRDGAAVRELEKLGVAFIRKPKALLDWISENGQDVDQVWIARPEIANEYMGALRRYTGAGIHYYTHDLHYLRMEREAEVSSDANARAAAGKMLHLEISVFDAADVVMTPSTEEAELIRTLTTTRVQSIPPYFFDPTNLPVRAKETFDVSKDIIFIGGFPHTPNVDAAIIIVNEIMPIVWRSIPDAHVLLVGYAPPKAVLDLAGPRVTVTGQVPELEPYCNRSRIMLAPLRYGAGVKGKIVDALRTGLPVVTTGIGAEGIGITSGLDGIVAEAPQDLAEAAIELLADADRCAALSAAGIDLIRKRFSITSATEVMTELLGTAPRREL